MKCIRCDRIAEEVGTGWRCQYCGIRFWNDVGLEEIVSCPEEKEDVGEKI